MYLLYWYFILHAGLVHFEIRKEYKMLLFWSYQQLWAAMWMLGTELWSSMNTASSLNCWAISFQPHILKSTNTIRLRAVFCHCAVRSSTMTTLWLFLRTNYTTPCPIGTCCNSSIQKTEARESGVQGQPGLHRDTLSGKEKNLCQRHRWKERRWWRHLGRKVRTYFIGCWSFCKTDDIWTYEQA